MKRHWLPDGWYIMIDSAPSRAAKWRASARGVPEVSGESPTERQAKRDAKAALIREAWAMMDSGWTRGRSGNGSVVHLRIKGQTGSICGVKQLDDGPNIACDHSIPCGRCERIEQGTIARYVAEVAEMYDTAFPA